MSGYLDFATLEPEPAVDEQSHDDMPPLNPLAPFMQETNEMNDEPNAEAPHDERP